MKIFGFRFLSVFSAKIADLLMQTQPSKILLQYWEPRKPFRFTSRWKFYRKGSFSEFRIGETTSRKLIYRRDNSKIWDFTKDITAAWDINFFLSRFTNLWKRVWGGEFSPWVGRKKLKIAVDWGAKFFFANFELVTRRHAAARPLLK